MVALDRFVVGYEWRLEWSPGTRGFQTAELECLSSRCGENQGMSGDCPSGLTDSSQLSQANRTRVREAVFDSEVT